ncbi:unnamed protein product [Didymodactylos carnosus]|uniref:Glycerol-3-phosphate dehydrogenase [NAD(+)] n=1 Tax=Didymodactylos carnosus TaxID=1234261 RepID=A0A8S2DE79_9BILA|nr:unnamed protein product [Didymodactylos carnosus]CAF3665626.1 unnamed protein product [Didymodactylos carnosus]
MSSKTSADNKKKLQVAIVGSGNWGSAIASHIGEKVRSSGKDQFEEKISMWCKEEDVDGEKITELINRTHENKKYLPDHKISDNVVAIPDLKEAVKDADILVFVVPHQFLKKTCEEMKGNIKQNAFALSLIKGFYVDDKTNDILLISEVIKNTLNIDCLTMMGANIAKEVAAKVFCEATIGTKNKEHSTIIKSLIDSDKFRLRFFPDVEIIEMLGALKNIIAMIAGFSEGLECGFNTRAAILRLGLREMIEFCRLYHKESSYEIYLESCGMADLVASSLGGRNYDSAKKFVQTNKSLKEIEEEDLNGQSLQGPGTAEEVYRILKNKNLLDRFPLLRDAHLICDKKIKPKQLTDNLGNHPEFQTNQQ